MSALIPILTDIGQQAMTDALEQGTALKITHVALGDGAYTPTADKTSLVSERERVPLSNVERLPNHQLRLQAVVDSGEHYTLRELGLYTHNNVLIALWSHPEQALTEKWPNAQLLLDFSWGMAALPLEHITFVEHENALNISVAKELCQLATSLIDTQRRQIQLHTRLHDVEKIT